MLDDMPKGQSTSLVVDADDQFGAVALPPGTEPCCAQAQADTPRQPRESRQGKRARRAAQADRHFACARALRLRAPVARHHLLAELSAASRSQRCRFMPTTASSIFLFGTSDLPPDPVDLVVKDVDGTLHKVVASKSEADKFVNDTILMLDDERAQIKKAAHDDLDRAFAQAFQDREQASLELRRLVLRMETLLRRAEGVAHLGGHPLLRGRQIQVADRGHRGRREGLFPQELQGAGAEARGARPDHHPGRGAGGAPCS